MLRAVNTTAKIRAQAVNVTLKDAFDEYFNAVGLFDHPDYSAGEDLPLSLRLSAVTARGVRRIGRGKRLKLPSIRNFAFRKEQL